jgi:hypothetical protein
VSGGESFDKQANKMAARFFCVEITSQYPDITENWALFG